MTASDSTIGNSLRKWRLNSGFSQLELALAANVSARHISFIETGKTHPTREMVIQLAEAMALTIEQLNSLLIAAGYATERATAPPPIEPVQQLATRIIEAFAHHPAIVVNYEFDILAVNHGYRLLDTLTSGGLTKFSNLLELAAAPDGIQQFIANWPEVKGFAIERLRESTYSTNNPQLNRLLSEVTAFQPPDEPVSHHDQVTIPPLYMNAHLQIDDQIVRFYGVILTPGTPLDNNPHNLRVFVIVPVDPEAEQDWHNMTRHLVNDDADHQH